MTGNTSNFNRSTFANFTALFGATIIFLLLVGMLLCALVAKSRHPFLHNSVVRNVAETVVLSVMIFFVFVFLKPVNQFIYFQF
jgi:hypothetical protein